MIQESSSAMYPDSDFLKIPSCTECFISLHQDNQFYGNNIADYNMTNPVNSFNLSDYLWRKYYSELATDFSNSIQAYTTYYRSVQDFESSSFSQPLEAETQPPNILVSDETKIDSSKSNGQIWRPFSPSPSVLDLPCLPEMTKETEIEKLMTNRGTIPYIIPSKVKIEPSPSSVFTPVKKKCHKCSYCSSVFSNNVQLSNHVRIHRGYKAYTCDYPECSKSFTRNEELTRHRRIHSGYKPHLCTVCGKSFGRKDHLSKHLKTHLQVSEKKVYLCGVSGCGHRYTRSDALTRHKSTAHAIRKIKNI